MVPDAVPVVAIPFAHIAEKVPAIDVELWLVTCHEKPVHELADMPASGFDDQLPRGDGALGDEGASVGGAAAGLGASTLADSRSTPVQAPVSAAVIRKQRTMNARSG